MPRWRHLSYRRGWGQHKPARSASPMPGRAVHRRLTIRSSGTALRPPLTSNVRPRSLNRPTLQGCVCFKVAMPVAPASASAHESFLASLHQSCLRSPSGTGGLVCAGCPSCGGQRTGSCVSSLLCSCVAGQSRPTAVRTQPPGNCGHGRVRIEQHPCFA